MTEFAITAPDGKKYKVTGDSQEGAVAALKKMLGIQSVEGGQAAPINPAADRDAMRKRIEAAKSGALTISPERAAQQAAIDQPVADQITLDSAGGVLSKAIKVQQGLPFIGEYIDEAYGLFDPRMRDTTRAISGAMDRQHPVQSAALNAAGGVLGSVPLAIAAGPSIVAAAPEALGAKMITGAVTGAALGGTEGLASGYGAGDDGNRLDSALQRGALGAAMGGFLGAAAPAAAKGLSNLLEWMKGYDINVISRTLGVNKDAAKVIKAAVASDDFSAAESALRRAGGDAVLADASPGTAQLLDTAVQTSGAAARVARDAVETRASKANTRLAGAMDALLGPPEGVKAAAKGIASKTAGVRATAYERAYSSAINYADDTGRAVEGVLQRIDPATLKSAIGEANDAMRAAGMKNQQIMAEISKNGEVTFREMPNVQQLDEIKKALGALGRAEVDQFGRPTGKGIRANKLAADLRDAISNAVPSYKTAVKLGGDKIAEDQALDLGRKLLSPATTREAVRTAMDGASREAKAAARQGLRSHIDDALANVARTITDPNTDAREALKLIKDMSSRANKDKVAEVMGSRAKPLFDMLDEVSAHFELRSATARNSATASRIAGKEAVDAVTADGPLRQLMQGEPIAAMRSVVKAITGQTGEAQAARKQAIYVDIAKALTQKKGAAAEQALKTITGAIQGQPISSADAIRIARAVTTGGALAAYQTGTQFLPKR